MGEAVDAGDEVMDQLTRLGEKVDAAVLKFQETRPQEPEVAQSTSSGNTTRITFAGGSGVIAALMVGLVGGVCLGVSVFSAVWVSSAIQSQATMNNWTSQEVTAIRSYITNGKLRPMAPRPMGPQPKQEK